MNQDVKPLSGDAGKTGTIWSWEIVLLFAVAFLAYANIAVFFRFYDYLQSLSIDPRQSGLIIGVFSAVSLIVRPIVSPFFQPSNSRRFLMIGTVMVVIALAAYRVTDDFLSLMLVRSFHGLAFVVLGASLMAAIIPHIPKDRSAQAFGLLSIVVLIPNTIIPPVLPILERWLGGFTGTLLAFAGLTVLVLPIALKIAPSRERPGRVAGGESPLTRSEVFANLGDRRILALLASMLMLYCGNAMVFFFLNEFGQHIGIAGVGFFLTLTTAGEIGVRVFAGSLFDRMNKARLARWTMIGLAGLYVLLANAHGEVLFFSVGAFIGIGWGIGMPVFNGLMFDVSSPRLQAFNSNLGLQMFQGGYFIGPLIGAPIAAQWGVSSLYLVCAGLSLAGALILLYPIEKGKDGAVSNP